MTPDQIRSFKQKALQYASNFEVCCYLDSHHYEDKHSKHQCLIAFGTEKELHSSVGDAFSSLKSFALTHKDWLFGLFTYDLKNETEDIQHSLKDNLNFPDLYFFIPQNLIAIKGNEIQIIKGN